MISVVTPVYNAAQYLNDTYESLLRQTYTGWQWHVVDDGSTDDSSEILRHMAEKDSRIHVSHQSNSGSAKQPRDRAVYESSGEYILMLDADDWLDERYIERMLSRMQETGADIVYPKMLFEKDGRMTEMLPDSTVNTDTVINGREAVKLTLPDWHIGCNGGLYRRSAWINMSYPATNERIYMNSDEVDERLYQINATKVAFCIDAIYHYRLTDTSITSSFSSKRFDVIHTNQQLCEIMKREFGESSQEFLLAGRKAIAEWLSCFSLFLCNYDKFQDDGKRIMDDFKHTYLSLPKASLSGVRDKSKLFGLRSFKLTRFLLSLKYNPALTIRHTTNAQ